MGSGSIFVWQSPPPAPHGPILAPCVCRSISQKKNLNFVSKTKKHKKGNALVLFKETRGLEAFSFGRVPLQALTDPFWLHVSAAQFHKKTLSLSQKDSKKNEKRKTALVLFKETWTLETLEILKTLETLETLEIFETLEILETLETLETL